MTFICRLHILQHCWWNVQFLILFFTNNRTNPRLGMFVLLNLLHLNRDSKYIDKFVMEILLKFVGTVGCTCLMERVNKTLCRHVDGMLWRLYVGCIIDFFVHILMKLKLSVNCLPAMWKEFKQVCRHRWDDGAITFAYIASLLQKQLKLSDFKAYFYKQLPQS